MTQPPTSTRTRFAQASILAVALLSLLPLLKLAAEWVEYKRDLGLPLSTTPPRGFDGVRWDGAESPVAAFVFPAGPADDAGLLEGDVLLRIDFAPIRSVRAASLLIDRAAGTVMTYEVQRGATIVQADIAIGRYPTFLYPLATPLWAAAGWGFAVATFLHLLALLTVLPLARRSARARRSAFLVGAAVLWVGGSLLRILWITAYGVPERAFGSVAVVLDTLTVLSFIGWTFFPALLLRHFFLSLPGTHPRWLTALIFVPPIALALGVSVALIWGHAGPMPADGFVAPILFYVCVYIAAGSVLVLTDWRPQSADRDDAGAPPDAMQRIGYVTVLALALLGAGFALTLHPSARMEADVLAGWFVTALQLFSLLPVTLVSLSVLRLGSFDLVLARGLRYAALFGGVFIVVAAAAYALNAAGPHGASPLALAALITAVVGVGAWSAPMFRRSIAGRFESDQSRAKRTLERFGEHARLFLSKQEIAGEAARAVGLALSPQSVAVSLLAGAQTGKNDWVHSVFPLDWATPEWPHSEPALQRVIEHGRVWSRNDELNEADMPDADDAALRSLGAALAVPVHSGDGRGLGLILLGRKTRRFLVYTTEEVERLRGTAGQVALAIERLELLEREKKLVRQTAEAELTALRAQINPHFLFNALNTVASLIGERPDEAETTVESLAGLFRDVLTASGKPFVRLHDEMRLVRRYLDVEQARFGEKLDVAIHVPADSSEVMVPAFAVQTLAENAVKHGIERKRGGGAVSIRASVRDGGLTVVVADTGVGLPALFQNGDGLPAEGDAQPFFGDGLGNVHQRLRHLYGGGASLAFTSSPAGTTVTLRLPAHTDPH